jgi:hypothetical protein
VVIRGTGAGRREAAIGAVRARLGTAD